MDCCTFIHVVVKSHKNTKVSPAKFDDIYSFKNRKLQKKHCIYFGSKCQNNNNMQTQI